MRMTEKKLLTANKVAEMLGFKPRTVARWCREGKFPSAHKVGRVWRIDWADVKLHLMMNKQWADDYLAND